MVEAKTRPSGSASVVCSSEASNMPAKKKAVRRPLLTDPTRTGLMRRQFASKIKAKFSRLKARIIKIVSIEDAFGLKVTQNASFRFSTDPAKIAAFKTWLRNELYS